jgi:hypothetical protein
MRRPTISSRPPHLRRADDRLQLRHAPAVADAVLDAPRVVLAVEAQADDAVRELLVVVVTMPPSHPP